MPSPSVKTAVSGYEHLNSKYPFPSVSNDTGDENGSDESLQLKPPKQSQLSSKNKLFPFQDTLNMNNNNATGPILQAQDRISLTQLLEDFGQLPQMNEIPVPTAFSPGMIKSNPALFDTPEKSLSSKASLTSTKEHILEPQDVNKIPLPLAWSPGMRIHPDPNLFVTPDKPAGKKVIPKFVECEDYGYLKHVGGQKENLDQNTLGTKSVRFDLPSVSSGEDTFVSDCESPITIKGSEVIGGESPIWKSFSPQKAYNPYAYSDESSLDESILNTLPKSNYNTMSNSAKGVTSSSVYKSITQSASQDSSLPSTFRNTTDSSGNASTHFGVSKRVQEEVPLQKMDSLFTSKQRISKARKSTSSGQNRETDKKSKAKAGPQFIKAPTSMYEPSPPGPYVVREMKNNVESTEYSYPFKGEAVGGDSDFEHAFARPEFNSTLKVRGELDSLNEQEVDVERAVETALAKSESKRTELNEKAATYTNCASQQFGNLVELEPSVDGLCERIVRMRTAKAPGKKKPAPSEKKPHGSHKAPDLMEFFTSDLQRETPDLNLLGVNKVAPQLMTASHDVAFDLYRHNRMWQGIRDF